MAHREPWAQLIVDEVDKADARLVLVRQALPVYVRVESLVQERAGWRVRRTTEGTGPSAIEDRNDPSVEKLIVFEDAPIAEEESLNAFQVLDSPAQVQLARGALGHDIAEDIAELIAILIDAVEPDVEALFRFVAELATREDQDTIGDLFPMFGLFRHSSIVGFRRKQQRANAIPRFFTQRAVERIEENRDQAQRLGEFTDRAIDVLAGRLDEQRAAAAYTDLVKFRDGDLTGDELIERLDFAELDDLTTRRRAQPVFVQMLIGAGLAASDARAAYTDAKRGDMDEERLSELLGGAEPGDAVLTELRRLRESDPVVTVPSLLVGVLATLRRQEFPPGTGIELVWTDGPEPLLAAEDNGRLAPLTLEVAQELVRATESSASIDIGIRVQGSEDLIGEFKMVDATADLNGMAEDWTIVDDDHVRESARDLIGARYDDFAERVRALREVVDAPVGGEEEPDEDPDSGKNNDIYLAFDLVFLAERDLFRGLLADWSYCASALFRGTTWTNEQRERFLPVAAALARFGLASGAEAAVALPYHPLRLRKLIQVIEQLERWLVAALNAGRGPAFDLELVREQLILRHLPRVAPLDDGWLTETEDAGYWSHFAPAVDGSAGAAPMWKGRAKLDQFGRVMPFARDRLQLASYPSGVGADVSDLVRADSGTAAHLVLLDQGENQGASELERQILDPDARTGDLLVTERGESLLPSVTFERRPLREDQDAAYHVAVLVDTFVQNEPHERFEHLPPPLTQNDWQRLNEAAQLGNEDADGFAALMLDGYPSMPAYAETAPAGGRKTLVYAPAASDMQRERGFDHDPLSLTWYALTGWAQGGNAAASWEEAYHETYEWDAALLQRLHEEADWIVMLDRFLDRRFFDSGPTDVKLIDFMGGLAGGYNLSVSSSRAHTVTLQLERAVRRCGIDLDEPAGVAAAIVEQLAAFAGGLLLKCIGGGALVEELLGLYATYCQLEAAKQLEGVLLVPVDEHQHWFGRRTSSRRRADLLLIRRLEGGTALEFMIVESKWRKPRLRVSDLRDMVRQIEDTRETLTELFAPQLPRLDDDFWRQELREVILTARRGQEWDEIANAVGVGNAQIGEIAGRVFVHLHQFSDVDVATDVETLGGEEPERIEFLRAFGRESIAAVISA